MFSTIISIVGIAFLAGALLHAFSVAQDDPENAHTRYGFTIVLACAGTIFLVLGAVGA